MSGASILVVDDDPRSLKLLRDILGQHGYEVRVATSGEEACAEVRAGYAPAVVLMDYRLPGMDGIETIAEMRALPHLAATKYIAVTASVMAEQLAALRAAGIPHHAKPIRAVELLAEVQRLTQA